MAVQCKKIKTGIDEIGKLSFWRAVLAECFGTMFFILSLCLVVQHGSGDLAAKVMRIGLGVGLTITSVAIMIGHVSGAHLNPAVSLGAILAGRISILQGVMYIPSQIVGSIAGVALAYGLSPSQTRGGLGVLGLGKHVTVEQGFGLELLFTFVLVFFILSITDDQRKVDEYSTVFGIGICVFVCHLFLVPMTGCGLNPARAIGPAIIMDKWNDHWVYWVGPLVASPLAAFFYNFLFFRQVEKCNETTATEMNGKSNHVFDTQA